MFVVKILTVINAELVGQLHLIIHDINKYKYINVCLFFLFLKYYSYSALLEKLLYLFQIKARTIRTKTYLLQWFIKEWVMSIEMKTYLYNFLVKKAKLLIICKVFELFVLKSLRRALYFDIFSYDKVEHFLHVFLYFLTWKIYPDSMSLLVNLADLSNFGESKYIRNHSLTFCIWLNLNIIFPIVVAWNICIWNIF